MPVQVIGAIIIADLRAGKMAADIVEQTVQETLTYYGSRPQI